MKCSECKTQLIRAKATDESPYHYIESGLDNVYLTGIHTLRCPRCHEAVPEIPCVKKVHRAIAEQIIQFPRTLTGSEVRFLRKDLELKAVEFAQLLRTTPVTVSRWETGSEPIGRASDQLVRLFYKVYYEEKRKSPVAVEIIGRFLDTHETGADIAVHLTIRPGCKISARPLRVAA